MTLSTTSTFNISSAVNFKASAASGALLESFHNIDEHPSGEITE